MWPTPTPIPTPSSLPSFPIDGNQLTGQVSDGIIQGWNWFNNNPVATVVWLLLLVTLIVVGLISIRSHMEKL